MTLARRIFATTLAICLLLASSPAIAVSLDAPVFSSSAVSVGQRVVLRGALDPVDAAPPMVEVQRRVGAAWVPVASMQAVGALGEVRTKVGPHATLVRAPALGGVDQTVTVSAFSPLSGVRLPDFRLPATLTAMAAPVAVVRAASDGRSSLFSEVVRTDPPTTPRGVATSVLSSHVVRTGSGAKAEVFSASVSAEYVNEGDTYVRVQGRPARRLVSYSGMKTMTFAPPVPTKTGFGIASIVREADMDTSIRFDRTDGDFTKVTARRLVARRSGYNYQAYSLMRHSSGLLVLPVCFAPTSALKSGPWMLQMLVSADDGDTWTVAGSTWLGGSAGMMEPSACELRDGRVLVVFRNDLGRVGRVFWTPGKALPKPELTRLVSPSAALDVRSLPDGGAALAWIACRPATGGSSLPRKVLALATSDDGFQTVDSVHVVATGASAGDSMQSTFPYLSQPNVSVVDGALRVGYERLLSPAKIQSYSVTASLPLPKNVVSPGDSVVLTESAGAAQEWHLLAAVEPASFSVRGDQLGIGDEWTASIVPAKPGAWRARASFASAGGTQTTEWQALDVGCTSLVERRLSTGSVSFGRPAVLSARLMSHRGLGIARTRVYLYRDGRSIASQVTDGRGRVSFRIGSSRTASWKIVYRGSNALAASQTRSVSTSPIFAFRRVASSGGTITGTTQLRRGQRYRLLAPVGSRVKLVGGAYSCVLSAGGVFTVPATGTYRLSGTAPRGKTVSIW